MNQLVFKLMRKPVLLSLKGILWYVTLWRIQMVKI